MKARISLLLTLTLLALGATFINIAPVAAAGPLDNTCVRIYEDEGPSGDSWAECAGLMGDANLTGNTTGLHNGCNGANWPFTNPDWNDCISGFRVSNLPGGYRVVFYINSNYGIRNRCVDDNGTNSYNMNNVQHDRTSSWRVESGSC